jgi:hypothetical protein
MYPIPLEAARYPLRTSPAMVEFTRETYRDVETSPAQSRACDSREVSERHEPLVPVDLVANVRRGDRREMVVVSS